MEENKPENIIPVSIEDEVKQSYLTYAMSVIVSRALPDVRDGLKPVHRRILYAMNELGLASNKETKKCARIVGEVLGKYHPHGDQSVYDALVRMAQWFSLKYPLVYGQGNFGNLDGDSAAAMRYTEAKMEKYAELMMTDINKETVDWTPNYDESTKEPVVLPSAFPNLLVNGSNGIAVGMATNMAPHNINEVCAAISAYINQPEISVDELMGYIKGPDFPTGGIIYGVDGIRKAYRTGRGKVLIRAKCAVETLKSGRMCIVVSEIPYMVNKKALLERIADLVKDKKIEDISALRDESSDRVGVRIVIELKKEANVKLILNKLYLLSDLQKSFSINNLALVKGKPETLNLKQLIFHYVEHRKEVVTRRTVYDLNKAKARCHILEGLQIALANIDEIITIIKTSKTVEEARQRLIQRFNFSEIQANAILEMRLQKLTNLESQKILDELAEIKKMIAYYEELLADEGKLMGVVKTEIDEVSNAHQSLRHTEILLQEAESIEQEDIIAEEKVVVLISNKGFIKRQPLSSYRTQKRGGVGSSSTKFHLDDFLEHLFIASTHDYILFLTNEGKAYYLKVHEIPESSKTAKGTHIKQLLSITANEEITTVVDLKEFNENTYLFMASRSGNVKRLPISELHNAKTRGKIALRLQPGDRLVSAILTDGTRELFLVTRKGLALHFKEETVRIMGRAASGVRGIKLSKDDEVVGVLSIQENEQLFLLSEFGYAKRTALENSSSHNRGTKGMIYYKTSEKTGDLIGALSIHEQDELVCITSQGMTLKLEVKTIPVLGRAASGVRAIQVKEPDCLVGMARVVNEEESSEKEE